MGARSESRATGAIMRLRAEGFLDGTAGEVVWLPLDVSTPASTALGAEVFLEREQRLDILGKCLSAFLSSSFADL